MTITNYGGPGSGPQKGGGSGKGLTPNDKKREALYNKRVKSGAAPDVPRRKGEDRVSYRKRADAQEDKEYKAWAKKNPDIVRLGRGKLSEAPLADRVAFAEAKNAFLKKGFKKEDAEDKADEFMKKDGKGKLKMLADNPFKKKGKEPFGKPNHVADRMDKIAEAKAKEKQPFGGKR